VILCLLILATTVVFWPISRLAGGLMVPYLLWVTFAAALNFAIWRLNA
jgi:benzodiazapine receptor